MNKSTYRLFLEDVISTFGTENQYTKVTEEFAELIQAVCKFRVDPCRSNKEHLIEELADTLIMIRQLRIMADIENSDITSEMHFKLRRLQYRMNLKKGKTNG